MHDRFPHTVLLLLTGYADFQYAQTAIRYGVFDYMLKPLGSDELKVRLERVELHLERLHPRDELQGLAGASAQQVFEMIRNYLQNHYASKIDLQSLSEAFGYSPAYLTKLFRKYVDTTPLRFLTDIRIHAAAQLLRATDLPVAEVGEQVGYPDPFYFSRVFKRYKGVNPQAYRGREP
jgi:two-component system response regulator YesN